MECHGSVDSAKRELISLIISVGEPELQNEISPMLPENRLTGRSERSEQHVPRRRCGRWPETASAQLAVGQRTVIDQQRGQQLQQQAAPEAERAARAVNSELCGDARTLRARLC